MDTSRLILLTLALAGCDAAETEPACPSEPALEAIHAAAFHFQSGDLEQARRALTRAQRLAPRGETSRYVLRQLAVIDARADERDFVRSEVEYVRLALGDWTCLDRATHDRFHESLPPIPGS